MQINTKKLVEAFEDNPVAFMAAGSGLLIGFSKIIDAAGHARGSNAYAKQVKHRIKTKK